MMFSGHFICFMQAGVDLVAWGACLGVSTQHRRYADIKHSKTAASNRQFLCYGDL